MRRPFKWCLAAGISLVMAELGARVVLHEWHPDGALEVGAAVAVTGPREDDPAERRRQRDLRGERLHPFLGFLSSDIPEDRPSSVVGLDQPEFYEPSSPIFSDDPVDLVVGVTGGSVAEQFTRLGGTEALAPLLSAQRPFEGRRVRVVTLAFAGAKQPQQLMALEYVLVQGGRLDLVINLDGFNEIGLHEWENERYGVSPLYPRLWLLRVERLNLAPLYGELQYLAARRTAGTDALLASPFRASGIRQLAWAIGDRSLRGELASVDERIRSYQSDGQLDFVTQGPRRPDATYEDRLDTLVDIWRRSSSQMQRTCDANGIGYYHFLQPNQYLPGSKPMSPEEARVAIKEGQPYGRHVPAGYPRLQDSGAKLVEAGVRFHDLSAVFEDHPEVLYVDKCCHINAAGNSVLARAIAGAIGSWN